MQTWYKIMKNIKATYATKRPNNRSISWQNDACSSHLTHENIRTCLFHLAKQHKHTHTLNFCMCMHFADDIQYDHPDSWKYGWWHSVWPSWLALAGLFGHPPCYHTFNFMAHCTKSSKGNKTLSLSLRWISRNWGRNWPCIWSLLVIWWPR